MARFVAAVFASVLFCGFAIESSKTCEKYEFACDDGECIVMRYWCDNVTDCNDKSDEKYCATGDSSIPCKTNHFRCQNGVCIPLDGKCDGERTCKDGSDEANCPTDSERNGLERSSYDVPPIQGYSSTSRSVNQVPSRSVGPQRSLDYHRTLAENWILSQIKDFQWGDDTPRAIIALYLSDREFFRNTSSEVVMITKKLELQVMLELLRNQTRPMPLSTLATLIAALLATCKDPRNFHAVNLVDILRRRVSIAQQGGIVNPFVHLVLCLLGESHSSDLQNIWPFFSNGNNYRLDLLSVVVVAATCIEKTREGRSDLGSHAIGILRSKLNKAAIGNVYETAVILQAMNEVNDNSTEWRIRKNDALQSLLMLQDPSGSFGDMSAMYYVMPMLSGNYIQSLRYGCSNRETELSPFKFSSFTDNRKISFKYSLVVGNSSDVTYTLRMHVPRGTSIFEVMEIAQKDNPMFTFLYDSSADNFQNIYSIAFIPNDVEKGKYWVLYKEVKTRSVSPELMLLSGDIQTLTVDNNDHIVFWYK